MFGRRKFSLPDAVESLESLALSIAVYKGQQQNLANNVEEKIFELEQQAAEAHGNAYRAGQALVKIREAIKAIND